MPQPHIYSLIDKAVYDYELIKPGDKILIGASGGKDSTMLIEYFANRKRRPDSDFDFTALNIQSDFAEKIPDQIENLFEKWNVEFKSIYVEILERLKPGRKMSCYWCSTQRRTELLRYAMANGYNKIALGHHMDDVLETLLMNSMIRQNFSTMPACLNYQKYPVSIIRPLYYVAEKEIVEYSKEKGYYGWTCTCNYQENSDRKAARKQLELFTGGDDLKKNHFFWALKNMKKDYLP